MSAGAGPHGAAASLAAWMERMAAALGDADVRLVVEMGGLREVTEARAWQGQVLVEWERDEDAGGCLLRPELVRRLALLGARVTEDGPLGLRVRAAPRVVASLSPRHAGLAAQLGRAPALDLTLHADAKGHYTGGTEMYHAEGARSTPLLRLDAAVRRRTGD